MGACGSVGRVRLGGSVGNVEIVRVGVLHLPPPSSHPCLPLPAPAPSWHCLPACLPAPAAYQVYSQPFLNFVEHHVSMWSWWPASFKVGRLGWGRLVRGAGAHLRPCLRCRCCHASSCGTQRQQAPLIAVAALLELLHSKTNPMLRPPPHLQTMCCRAGACASCGGQCTSPSSHSLPS